LEALAGLGLPVLLALHFTRISGQETDGLELRTQLAVELEQGARDSVADRARLTGLMGKYSSKSRRLTTILPFPGRR
jgi:hypothetical protein